MSTPSQPSGILALRRRPARTGGGSVVSILPMLLATLSFLSLAATSPSARAADPFTLTAQPTSGTAVSVSGHSLLDLSDNLIQSKNQFQSLSGQPFSASLRYGSLNNAFTYSQNAAGTSSTLGIPSIGFSRTFTGATSSDLRHNIRTYLEHEGSDIYARFLRQVNANTYLGVTDGNPLSTTALLAKMTYDEFGYQRPPTQPLWGDVVDTERVTGGFHLSLNGGYFESRDGNGYFGQATIHSNFRINDRISLSLGTMVNYRNQEDAQVYHIGGEIALPILILPSAGDRSFSWQLTPAFLTGGSGSVDLAAGGLFYGGGITSSLSYRLDPFTLTMANHYSFFQGYPVGIGNYHFDTDVNQQLLKNGFKVTYALNPGCGIEFGATYTNFLNASRVRNYWSPDAGIVLRLGDNGGLRIAYQGDFTGGFRDNGGVIQFFFGY